MLPTTNSARPSNPWLSKGTKHLFNSSTQRLPSNAASNPIKLNESSHLSNRRDYYILPDPVTDISQNEMNLSLLHELVCSLEMDQDKILRREGKLVDQTVMEGFSTVGIVNDGNHCYQNSIFQVSIRFFSWL